MPGPPVDLRREAAPARAKSRTWCTSTEHDHIKGSSSRSLNGAARFLPLRMQGISCSLFWSWVGCTMTTAGQPEAGPRVQ